ncbi:MAG: SpoIIE family protein phosphatase, partial [Anaerolineae bacterium]
LASSWATAYGLLVGLSGLAILVVQLARQSTPLAWLPILVFAILSLLVQRSSFHFGSPLLHSLSGVIDVAAVLSLGPTAGALVAALSGGTYLVVSALHHRRTDRRSLLVIPVFNSGLKALMALTAGALFQLLAGPLPYGEATSQVPTVIDILAVSGVSLLWFVLDHLGWGLMDLLEVGPQQVRAFFQAAVPQVLLIELVPLPASLVVALVYTSFNRLAFGLVAIGIIAISVLARHWADARNQLVQRMAEVSAVEQIGRAIAEAQLDVNELCQLLYDYTERIVDATIFHLGLFEGDKYAIKLWVQNGQPEPSRTFQLTPGVGLVNWQRESKQPLLVRDLQKEADSLPAKPSYVSGTPPRSALFVPLMVDQTVVGTLSVQSFRPGAYSQEDLQVLSAMANQAALAIQKAQLYAQERKRARQLETISQISRQITATMELDELFERAVHLIRDNFGYYHVTVYTANPELGTVTFQASASAEDQQVSIGVEWGQGLIGWVAAQSQAVMVNDVKNDSRYRCVEALEETQSELAVPLILEDELVGVLDVQSDQSKSFGPDDLFILETLGDQLAIAIQEARLYEAERQQAWLSTALLQVADAMSQVSDMDSVLSTIVRLTPLLVGVDRCTILLWDAVAEEFIPTQTYGLEPELRERFEQLSFQPDAIPALDLMRLDKRPLLIRVDDKKSLIPQEIAETFAIQEMLLLPLLAQGELLGAMMVDYAGQAHTFPERVVDMLTGIANQAAMVIQTARLVQAQRQEAYVSMALLQVAESLNRAANLAEILETIVRITPILAGVEGCAILLRDPETEMLLPYQEYGLDPEERASFFELRLPLGALDLRQLSDGGAYVHLEERDSHFAPLLGDEAALTLPMSTKGELMGTMLVRSDGKQHANQRWMNILTGIANQTAIAIENDRLMREAAEQERLQQELAVGQRIQASFLPEQSPSIPGWSTAVIWRSARQVGGDFYDFIPLPANSASQPAETAVDQGRVGIVIADVADKGVPAALFMALSRTLLRTVAMDGRQPAAAVGRTNDLIVADARSDLFVTMFYAILQPNLGEVVYTNAGHTPPLLVRAAGTVTEELQTEGMAMGVLSQIEFEEKSALLVPGDLLVLYTDGVTEASNPEGEMFGQARLLETVQENCDRPVDELCRAIDAAVNQFVGSAPQFDDFTLMIVKRESPPAIPDS